jgi:hypothetical protein
LNWEGEVVTEEILERRAASRELDSVVRHVSSMWRVQNMALLQSDDYVMEREYDSARFLPSQEVAWLRARRRRRDRARRRRIRRAGEGLTRYRP